MRPYITLTLSILFLILAKQAHAADSLMIHSAWIPEMPPVSRVHAGFASFHNASDEDIEITAVSSADYASIEMHLSKQVDDMARMIPQKSLIVQANQMMTLKNGGYHLMLFKPQRKLIAGDSVRLTLELSDGKKQSFNATVKKSSEENNHQHHHH
ncbi:MAG: copper chaperone PCu(A)C [Gammaproteobacteria bacterium]|nr:copper chaperone PCu(A)C [Gammaproteobacteria bacterium]